MRPHSSNIQRDVVCTVAFSYPRVDILISFAVVSATFRPDRRRKPDGDFRSVAPNLRFPGSTEFLMVPVSKPQPDRFKAGLNACITIWDFTGRKDSSGNQRESATLFPQGLSLYSRRAFPLFPQGCPFIPAGLALYSRRASAGAPGIQLLPRPGLRRRRWPGSVPPGMRARDDSALTEVGCCPQAAAACKLRGSPRPGP